MDINKLEDIINLNPFKNMKKIKINLDDNCLLGNRCFVKVGNVRYIPTNSIETSESIMIRGHKFTLLELLYSPFHFQQSQHQYILPGFILTCIEKAKRNKNICKYCITDRGDGRDSLSINIFIQTIYTSVYIIIGLRIKYFWSSNFEIE
ncbi:hypothetical protein DpV84gp037 [Deerpox virus W-1170-84]|uniref:Uncharacterized protein n=1 Tax=Deerpox virus (strain W-1170-84) TaxID=305676 RepID=Q08FE4_DPV84|nr:hypothetical protein DpV84gp037 [Deerpox virus W-1170-84]